MAAKNKRKEGGSRVPFPSSNSHTTTGTATASTTTAKNGSVDHRPTDNSLGSSSANTSIHTGSTTNGLSSSSAPSSIPSDASSLSKKLQSANGISLNSDSGQVAAQSYLSKDHDNQDQDQTQLPKLTGRIYEMLKPILSYDDSYLDSAAVNRFRNSTEKNRPELTDEVLSQAKRFLERTSMFDLKLIPDSNNKINTKKNKNSQQIDAQKCIANANMLSMTREEYIASQSRVFADLFRNEKPHPTWGSKWESNVTELFDVLQAMVAYYDGRLYDEFTRTRVIYHELDDARNTAYRTVMEQPTDILRMRYLAKNFAELRGQLSMVELMLENSIDSQKKLAASHQYRIYVEQRHRSRLTTVCNELHRRLQRLQVHYGFMTTAMQSLMQRMHALFPLQPQHDAVSKHVEEVVKKKIGRRNLNEKARAAIKKAVGNEIKRKIVALAYHMVVLHTSHKVFLEQLNAPVSDEEKPPVDYGDLVNTYLQEDTFLDSFEYESTDDEEDYGLDDEEEEENDKNVTKQVLEEQSQQKSGQKPKSPEVVETPAISNGDNKTESFTESTDDVLKYIKNVLQSQVTTVNKALGSNLDDALGETPWTNLIKDLKQHNGRKESLERFFSATRKKESAYKTALRNNQVVMEVLWTALSKVDRNGLTNISRETYIMPLAKMFQTFRREMYRSLRFRAHSIQSSLKTLKTARKLLEVQNKLVLLKQENQARLSSMVNKGVQTPTNVYTVRESELNAAVKTVSDSLVGNMTAFISLLSLYGQNTDLGGGRSLEDIKNQLVNIVSVTNNNNNNKKDHQLQLPTSVQNGTETIVLNGVQNGSQTNSATQANGKSTKGSKGANIVASTGANGKRDVASEFAYKLQGNELMLNLFTQAKNCDRHSDSPPDPELLKHVLGVSKMEGMSAEKYLTLSVAMTNTHKCDAMRKGQKCPFYLTGFSAAAVVASGYQFLCRGAYKERKSENKSRR